MPGHAFHNTSKLNFQKLKGEPDKAAQNLSHYIKSFSSKARQIFEYFEFEKEIAKLDESNRLYLVVGKFADIDLHPDAVPNHEMGLIFEDLIRRFNEASNETAGDHFTPREVIRLMVNLLFTPDSQILRTKGIVNTLYDPACGTGGMLCVAEEHLRELNPDARLEVFGQDYNDEAFAICRSDMMIKGQNPENIKFGNSFTQDGLPGQQVRLPARQPALRRGVETQADVIEKEHDEQAFQGRFGAGLPRINDGSLLFLMHMISKMKPEGSRLAIVFNGSPLFTGDAGSGRERDPPLDHRERLAGGDRRPADQMFYNTGISTYIWVLTNRKRKERRGKVQLINAVDLFVKMRKSLGNKRNELSNGNIAEIVELYGDVTKNGRSKVFDNEDFGYRQITVERPLRLAFQVTPERIDAFKLEAAFQKLATTKKKGKQGQQEIEEGQKARAEILAMLEGMAGPEVDLNRPDFEKRLEKAAGKADVKLSAPVKKAILSTMSERDEAAEICLDQDGNPEPDTDLRDYENVPLKEDIHAYFEREVKPHVPDAWIDESKTKVGYEIPFNRHFYKYMPPRPLEEIKAEIKTIEQDILNLLAEVAG